MPVEESAVALADWLMAGGTVVLVLVTGWYAFLTHRISKASSKSSAAAEESAKAARESVIIAERALIANQMPLITSRPGARAHRGDSVVAIQGFHFNNVGVGTAFNIEASFPELQISLGRVPKLKPGGEHELKAQGNDGMTLYNSVKTDERIDLVITYEDGFGHRFTTTIWGVGTAGERIRTDTG